MSQPRSSSSTHSGPRFFVTQSWRFVLSEWFRAEGDDAAIREFGAFLCLRRRRANSGCHCRRRQATAEMEDCCRNLPLHLHREPPVWILHHMPMLACCSSSRRKIKTCNKRFPFFHNVLMSFSQTLHWQYKSGPEMRLRRSRYKEI
jgi:hypothetical protein